MKRTIPRQGPEAESIWRQRLEEQRASGLSKSAYCREHRLKDHALTYWTTKFNKEAKTKATDASFAKVTVAARNQPKATPADRTENFYGKAKLTFPSGAMLEITSDFDVNYVAQLMAATTGVK